MQHYFVDLPVPQTEFDLPQELAHHLITVMRANIGTQFELVFNDHRSYLVTVTQTQPAKAKVVRSLNRQVELPVQTIIACGLPKTKEKPELIVQKGTELGVDQIIFFDAARSISHWQGSKQARKIARLQKIADSAAEQSHRNRQPQVRYCSSLQQLLATYRADQRVVAWEESAKQGETSVLAQTLTGLQAGQSILAIFGPEGGLSSAEVSQMVAAGVKTVGLGPRILRTETAPLYFLSAVSYVTELATTN